MADLQSTLLLHDGNKIPVLGFGTYELKKEGGEAYNAVQYALKAGYRHIDSATWYDNETACGRAILDFCKDTKTPREAIFYTTKLMLNDGYEKTIEAIQFSLDECGLGYIDLYLIHGPLGGPEVRKESWRAICDAKNKGLIRNGSLKTGLLKSIGVSCFGIRHLKEIIDLGLEVPVINQIDLHPFMTRSDIVDFCQNQGPKKIVLEAWAPLVRGLRFDHPSIVFLARKYNKEPAQILLRYSLQKGYVAIPKSSSKTRIVSNTNIFDFKLDQKEVQDLDGLDEALVTDWDPTDEL
ncbi:Aldo/keto reductase [Mycena vulgaris]|nr:Aldo/keto reductase [Mycena vulgaris]